jgi:hypothetical protein
MICKGKICIMLELLELLGERGYPIRFNWLEGGTRYASRTLLRTNRTLETGVTLVLSKDT